jgi:hypothetical protein
MTPPARESSAGSTHPALPGQGGSIAAIGGFGPSRRFPIPDAVWPAADQALIGERANSDSPSKKNSGIPANSRSRVGVGRSTDSVAG